jgi:hypothetical protein
VVYQLDMAEESRSLSLDEQSLHEFLKDQIKSLQSVVEAQDIVVPPMAEDIPVPSHKPCIVEDTWLSQHGAVFSGCRFGDGDKLNELVDKRR